jgi:predicted NBD/HSP70 family sugar kinase
LFISLIIIFVTNAARDRPGSAMSPRDVNRLAVLELVFGDPGVVRSTAQERTGLSKATIYRIVEELTTDGVLVERPVAGQHTRGRPKLELYVAPAQGLVVGVDIGVLTTRMMVSDLNGSVLARARKTTPVDLSPLRLAAWTADQVAALCNEARDHGPLQHVVISLPAKIGQDQSISRPAGHLAYLAGSDFQQLVGALIGAPTELRSDPDMALLGEMTIGRAAGYRDVVMVVISSSLSASVAIDGDVLGGRRRVIGNFGAMPLADGRSLGDVLTVPGILARAERAGLQVTDVPTLSQTADPLLLNEIHDDFRQGLTTLLAAITLSVDPEIIVVAGSLLALIEAELPASLRELDRRLDSTVTVAVSETGGFSQPRGGVEVALGQARRRLADAVLNEPLARG